MEGEPDGSTYDLMLGGGSRIVLMRTCIGAYFEYGAYDLSSSSVVMPTLQMSAFSLYPCCCSITYTHAAGSRHTQKY